jgi:hypothetical protein
LTEADSAIATNFYTALSYRMTMRRAEDMHWPKKRSISLRFLCRFRRQYLWAVSGSIWSGLLRPLFVGTGCSEMSVCDPPRLAHLNDRFGGVGCIAETSLLQSPNDAA